MIPDQFHRYQIIARLGEGGMATVFLAYDPRMDRRVALKVLSPGFLIDPTFPKRFDQEVKIIARLEHPAIIPVYDYGQDHGCPYLVMRLMTGGTLKDRLERGALSLDETKVVMERICGALYKAHSQKIIHRDLKPGNILFDADGNAYLADFGIARLVERSQTMTIIGTPQYMAPEQALGQGLDTRTDIYQMGIVLYEMLTGRVPFDAATPPALLYAHAHSPIPLPTASRPALPPAADAIITRALAKQPDERFSTVKELNRAVTRLQLASDGTLVAGTRASRRPTVSPPQQAVRTEQEKKRPAWLKPLIGLAALASVALVVAGALFGPRVYSALTGRNATPTANLTATTQHLAALAAQLTPSATATASPTTTPSTTPTMTPSPTASPTTTQTPAPTDTATATRTRVPSPTPLQTPTPTITLSPTATIAPTLPAVGGGGAESSPESPTTEPTEEAAGPGEILSGEYYVFYEDRQWNRDTGLWEHGFYVFDLIALNTVTFIKTDSYDLHWVFDYDESSTGATACLSPGGQFELVVHQPREHYQSLIHYRIEADDVRAFIYEWDPNANYLQIYCLSNYFIVRFPDDSLYRGNYGEPVHPWYIGVPDSYRWWIGRAW